MHLWLITVCPEADQLGNFHSWKGVKVKETGSHLVNHGLTCSRVLPGSFCQGPLSVIWLNVHLGENRTFKLFRRTCSESVYYPSCSCTRVNQLYVNKFSFPGLDWIWGKPRTVEPLVLVKDRHRAGGEHATPKVAVSTPAGPISRHLSTSATSPKCQSLSCVWLFSTLAWSPPGSSVQGILQARTLEQVATPFSRGSSQSRDPTRVSRVAGRFFTIWAPRVLDINILYHW